MYYLYNGNSYIGVDSNNTATSVSNIKKAIPFSDEKKATNYLENLKTTLRKFNWQIIRVEDGTEDVEQNCEKLGEYIYEETQLEKSGFDISKFFNETVETVSQLRGYANNMGFLEQEYNKKILDVRHYKRDANTKLSAVQLQRLEQFEIQLERERYECKSNRMIAEIFLADLNRLENINYIEVVKNIKESIKERFYGDFMKRQIRRGVFETNSSSTHSIAIPKKCNSVSYMWFDIGEFGWGWEEVDPADYLYTAIYELSETEDEAKEKIEKLESILKENGIDYKLGKVKAHTWHSEYSDRDFYSLDDGYIDHAYELRELVDELLNDGDKLIRFISGGLVFTGNDNSDTEQRCFINRDEEFLEDYDWSTKTTEQIKNPYFMSNHEDYEWYWKGN